MTEKVGDDRFHPNIPVSSAHAVSAVHIHAITLNFVFLFFVRVHVMWQFQTPTQRAVQ